MLRPAISRASAWLQPFSPPGVKMCRAAVVTLLQAVGTGGFAGRRRQAREFMDPAARLRPWPPYCASRFGLRSGLRKARDSLPMSALRRAPSVPSFSSSPPAWLQLLQTSWDDVVWRALLPRMENERAQLLSQAGSALCNVRSSLKRHRRCRMPCTQPKTAGGGVEAAAL